MSVQVCVQVCECLPACESTWGWTAQALLAELLLLPQLPPRPVLLTVQIWSRNYFVEFSISSLGKSHQSVCTMAPGPPASVTRLHTLRSPGASTCHGGGYSLFSPGCQQDRV